MGKRQDRIISGLAEALGLVGVTPFEIMKTAAEALGCEVHADGTTTVEVSIVDWGQPCESGSHHSHLCMPAG